VTDSAAVSCHHRVLPAPVPSDTRERRSGGAGIHRVDKMSRPRGPCFAATVSPTFRSASGFYDLRLREPKAQAMMAAQPTGYRPCYCTIGSPARSSFSGRWKRWWLPANRTFLLCRLGEPDLSGVWHDSRRILTEQTYPGGRMTRHIVEYLCSTFDDPRYLRSMTARARDLPANQNSLMRPPLPSAGRQWRAIAECQGLHLVAYVR